MEIAQTIDKVLLEYYSGVPVPIGNEEDPPWWCEYLLSIGIDPATHESIIATPWGP